MKRAAAGTTLGFLVFAPTFFFTVVLAFIIGPFALALPAWVIWWTRRKVAGLKAQDARHQLIAKAGLVR